MTRFFRRLWRRLQRPVAIPGKYPWLTTPQAPPYGTILFEDERRKHYADGLGGIVSIEKRPRGAGIGAHRRRAF